MMTFDKLTVTDEVRDFYAANGYVVVADALPLDLVDAYVAARSPQPAGGWSYPTPYMDHPEIKDLCLFGDLADFLTDLVGEEMVLHLNLTGWVSTERNWHQDGYLNPDQVGDFYAAVWMALDDIDPRSGPFALVPGSHRWPERLTRQMVWDAASRDLKANPDWASQWPKLTEEFVVPFWEREIVEHDTHVMTLTPSKGSLIVWHPWLVHCGTKPELPGLERRALISHFSGVNHRDDMPVRQRHFDGGQFAVLPTSGRV